MIAEEYNILIHTQLWKDDLVNKLKRQIFNDRTKIYYIKQIMVEATFPFFNKNQRLL